MTPDVPALLTRFFQNRLDDAPGTVVNVHLAGAGRSRQNWVFDLDGGDGSPPEPLILRRDPEGGLVESDRSLEFSILAALTDSPLPTPKPRWLDADGQWFGKPSMIMRREPGTCDYRLLNGTLPLDQRLAFAQRLCALLVEVHQVDWGGLGLGNLLDDPGPRAAAHELDRWVQVLRHDQLEPYPELEFAISWLRRRAPESARTVLVHADFKPGNVLVRDGKVTALLDWEIAHLGDPLEDLGWVTQPLRTAEHVIAGHWEHADLVACYERLTAQSVDREALAWWQAFSTFKTAVMQVTGLRAFLEARSEEPYRPARRVLSTLLRQIAAGGE